MLSERQIQKYKNDIATINNVDSNIEDIKSISCAFYRGGGNPECKGCEQPDDLVRTCGDMYAANILDRPMEVWSPEFSALKEVPEEQKIKVGDVKKLGLSCNTCYMAEKCPEFKHDSMCSIKWGIEDDAISPKSGLDFLIRSQLKRISRLMIIEEYDGGVADQNLSVEMDRLARYYAQRADIDMTRIQINASASGPSNRDPNKPSILQTLFGGMINKPEEPKQIDAPIDIPYQEVEKEKRNAKPANK